MLYKHSTVEKDLFTVMNLFTNSFPVIKDRDEKQVAFTKEGNRKGPWNPAVC